jgi:Domain of unknown function (DUF4062)
MAFLASVVKVMIASPGDVAEERRIVRDVLSEWNIVNAEDKQMIAFPVGWETHATPEMGERPQEIINKQLLESCDLLIGIFWSRLGSPTGKHVSGTVEEIKEHRKAGKHAMLYFSTAPLPQSHDPQQFAALKEFREEVSKQALVESFASPEEFRDKFRQHFAQTMNRFNSKPSISEIEAVYSDWKNRGMTALGELDRVNLSNEARQLLVAAADDPNGRLLRIADGSDQQLQVNGRNLLENQNNRSIARWDEAIRELELNRYIESDGAYDPFATMFGVLDAGYKAADRLRREQLAAEAGMPRLQDEAKTLLMEATADRNGLIIVARDLGGLKIETNGKNFCETGNPRSEVFWRAIVVELETHELIQDRGYKGEKFNVTAEGYRVADVLRAASPPDGTASS